MTGMRHIVGGLWVALWLRWRLTGAIARRLWRRRSTAATAGAGYRVAPADIPVEGIDYDPDELPSELIARLERSRADFRTHARTAARRTRRRTNRRRTLSLLAAAIASLTVLGAGATALMTGSTGVPAVDRLLGIHQKTFEDRENGVWPRPGRGHLRPAPAGAGPSMEVPLRDGARKVLVTSYVAVTGDLCSTATDSDRAGKVGHVSCVTPAFAGGRLRRDAGLISATVGDRDALLLLGFVSDAVGRLSVRGPEGMLEVHLGTRWTPGIAQLGTLRPFVAVEPGRGAELNSYNYVVRAWGITGAPTRIHP